MANTFNPILQSRELKLLSPSNPRPSPSPGKTIVLAGQSQPLLVIKYGERRAPTRGQLMIRRYNWFYEIDVTEQQISFDELLQSNENIPAFRASVNISCSVRDPAYVVENNITDALRAIRPAISEALADIAIRYSVEELNQLRQEMRRISQTKVTRSGFNISRFSIGLALTKDAERIVSARAIRRLEHHNAMDEVRYEDEVKDARAIRAKRLMQEGVESLLAEHLSQNPNDVINVAKMLSERLQKEQELLKLADSIEDPDIRKIMIEKLTGKPMAELTSGSGSTNDQADYEVTVEDEDDVADEFRRG